MNVTMDDGELGCGEGGRAIAQTGEQRAGTCLLLFLPRVHSALNFTGGMEVLRHDGFRRKSDGILRFKSENVGIAAKEEVKAGTQVGQFCASVV